MRCAHNGIRLSFEKRPDTHTHTATWVSPGTQGHILNNSIYTEFPEEAEVAYGGSSQHASHFGRRGSARQLAGVAEMFPILIWVEKGGFRQVKSHGAGRLGLLRLGTPGRLSGLSI